MIEFRQLRHKAKLLIVSLINFVLGKLWGRKNKSFVPKTLLILRLDEIGDYVLFRNFLKEIRESERFKDYKITLCGNAAWKDLAEAFDKESVDEFIWISKSVKRGIEFEAKACGTRI
ncbi:MAG: hypothetical protein RML35_06685 [Chloroherpetonaceae bacterium]|nr:hypothetical protein [Chloroherpetonaceae bacterium]